MDDRSFPLKINFQNARAATVVYILVALAKTPSRSCHYASAKEPDGLVNKTDLVQLAWDNPETPFLAT